ncbi:hypothetical protein BG004_007327 [Podila humilis]|nr:hypothetical protein BG004_007327 [Podila humilis]
MSTISTPCIGENAVQRHLEEQQLYQLQQPPTESEHEQYPNYLRNIDLTNLHNSPNQETREVVLHIFRQMLPIQGAMLATLLLSIVAQYIFYIQATGVSVSTICHTFLMADFARTFGTIVYNSKVVTTPEASQIEPSGNFVADEIKRRGWSLFPAHKASPVKSQSCTKDICQVQYLKSGSGSTTPPSSYNYGATLKSGNTPNTPGLKTSSSSPLISHVSSLAEPSPSLSTEIQSVGGASALDAPATGTQNPVKAKATLFGAGKLAYSAQFVHLLMPGRYLRHLFILTFVIWDFKRRIACLSAFSECQCDNKSAFWLVAIILLDIWMELLFLVDDVVVYRAGQKLKQLKRFEAAARLAAIETQSSP